MCILRTFFNSNISFLDLDFLAPSLDRFLDDWLNEDLGRGDLTRYAFDNSVVSGHWVAKQSGIFCGGPLVKRLFTRLNQSVSVRLLIEDGDNLVAGTRLLNVQGPASVLVAVERTALNLAMHLSGIATLTAKLVFELEGTGVRLADTRKTTPGLRLFEKYAVRCGGGINHRLGLDDAAMLKENHLAWTTDICSAVLAIRNSAPWPSKVIVEAETKEQAEKAVLAGADGVLLDEFPVSVLHDLVPRLRDLAPQAVDLGGMGRVVLEASGVDPSKLKAYASTGIDVISTSAPITTSSWLDFSMRFDRLV